MSPQARKLAALFCLLAILWAVCMLPDQSALAALFAPVWLVLCWVIILASITMPLQPRATSALLPAVLAARPPTQS